MSDHLPTRISLNSYFQAGSRHGNEVLATEALAFHRQLPGYKATPLRDLPGLASELGISRLLLKDESQRFGLNAFKVLGASYAVYRFVSERWKEKTGEPLEPGSLFDPAIKDKIGEITFAAATEGNHGRAVAWAAAKLGQRSVIYVSEHVSAERIRNIENEGADIVIIPGNYDRAVEQLAEDAEKHGWQVISDTSWPGHEDIPLLISSGYQTIFTEIDETLAAMEIERPDFVFIQAGVGGLAGAAANYFETSGAKRPCLICIEPLQADCLLESVVSGGGGISTSKGRLDSFMSVLNCGVPSTATWPAVRDGFNLFMAIDDQWSKKAMKRLFRPAAGDAKVISGESGAAGLAGLLALLEDESLASAREQLGLDFDSTVLVLSTEGDNDRENFFRVLNE